MRYASLDQITPANVSQLKPACTFHTGFLRDPNMSMTPLVVDGTMYERAVACGNGRARLGAGRGSFARTGRAPAAGGGVKRVGSSSPQ